QHALVRRHDDVVEAVDPVAVEIEGAGQAAQRRAALEQGHLRALLLQAQREDRAEDPAADDADAIGTGAPQLVHGERAAVDVTPRSPATSSRWGLAVAAGAGSSVALSGDSGGGWMRPTMCAAIRRP